MAEESLSPGQNAIYFTDTLAFLATYRSTRDAIMETEQKLIRRTLIGCENSTRSRRMRSVPYYSTKTLHLTKLLISTESPLPNPHSLLQIPQQTRNNIWAQRRRKEQHTWGRWWHPQCNILYYSGLYKLWITQALTNQGDNTWQHIIMRNWDL